MAKLQRDGEMSLVNFMSPPTEFPFEVTKWKPQPDAKRNIKIALEYLNKALEDLS